MKSTAKKIAAVLLAVIFMAAAAACSSGNSSGGNGKKTIGIIQLIENGAFNDMREGFIDHLSANGYDDDKVEYIYKNAQGDMSNLNTICQEMSDKKVDLVVTIATPATQAMVNMDSGIPVVFISVSDPIGAGVMTDLAAPDKNATGTNNIIPVEGIFQLADQLTPGNTTYGMLYTTGEVNALATVNAAKAYMDANGIGYEEAVVSNSSEVQQAAQMLAAKVDALFCPNDSTVQNAMDLVAEVAKDAGIPLYGSSAVMVNSGAFATLAVSDRDLGAASAKMAMAYFDGTSIEDIPVDTVPADEIVINRSTADALGIVFSNDVEENAVFIG